MERYTLWSKINVEELRYEIGSWCYTKKEMYTIYQSYQSFEFETLAIRLNERYGYLDSIKNSPFRPGQYVKTVSVSNFNAPEHLLAINAATDPLYQLIRHTPKQKKFQLIHYQTQKNGHICKSHYQRTLIGNCTVSQHLMET